MTTTTPRRTNHREHPAIALIAARQCPCCEGALGASQWPSWLRCGDCECCWKIDTTNGLRYACIFRSPRCREEERT